MGVTCWGGDHGVPGAAEPHIPPACFPCITSSTLHDQLTAFRERKVGPKDDGCRVFPARGQTLER